jgi:lipopolysaccharide transport system permease protein
MMFLNNIYKNYSLVFELVKRDFSGRFKGSYGGLIWSFIHPLFLLSVYTIAFGIILKTRWGASGTTAEYALMLFAGLIVFNAFSECMGKFSTLITANPNFVKKIVFPLDMLPVVTVITASIQATIGVLVWLLGYMVLFGSPKFTVIFLPLIWICFLPILLGLGWLLSAIGVVARDIGQLTGMISHTLLFLTPIFYTIESVPPTLQKILKLNPLTFIVEQFRLVLFLGHKPDFLGLFLYFVLASIFAYLSLILFRSLRPIFADLL